VQTKCRTCSVLACRLAGGYGPYTADSAVLTEHLERLRQQQAVVMELIAAQVHSPDRHHSQSVATAHPLADPAGRLSRPLSPARQSATALQLLADPGLNPRARRSSAHDAAHLPPPVPRRVSHADGVVAVAPEGAGFPLAEKGPQQQQPLRPKVFREALKILVFTDPQ